jgi:hypothetical protein
MISTRLGHQVRRPRRRCPRCSRRRRRQSWLILWSALIRSPSRRLCPTDALRLDCLPIVHVRVP